MKKFFTLFFSCLSVFLLSSGLHAQVNQLYFGEGFEGGGFNTVNPSSSVGVANDYWTLGTTSASFSGGSGAWYLHNSYRTTGSGCSTATYAGNAVGVGTNHIRLLNPTTSGGSVTADTAYIVTPIVDFGIGTVHILRCGTVRKLDIFISSTDTSAAVNPMKVGQTTWTKIMQTPGGGTNCVDTTITINSSTAKRVAIMNGQAANTDIDSIILTSYFTIVPVRFGSINVANTNGLNKITWTSETEINTKEYVIERSVDGVNFTTAGVVSATGSIKYTWIDNTLSSGMVYYRVQGVDKSGSSNYSTIVKVSSSLNALALTVAPNPVRNGQLNLQMNNFTKGSYTVNLYNSTSQKVFTRIISLDGGSAVQQLQLPAGVKGGMYSLQLIGESVKLTRSLVIE
jgi:hypothetical protein